VPPRLTNAIAVTETGAGNATGAAVALYAADNYLTWIENGIVNVDYQILHTDMLLNNQTPDTLITGQ